MGSILDMLLEGDLVIDDGEMKRKDKSMESVKDGWYWVMCTGQ